MANTKQYAWKDIRVVLLGREVAGFQEIEYEPSFGKEYVMGRGNQPLGIQSTNKEFKGKITLLQSEHTALVKAIRAVDPTYDISDVAFDIVVAYGDGVNATTDVLRSCEITGYTKGMSQGDPNMAIEVEFMCLAIDEAVQ
jgi:hypothetical protein